MRKTVLLLASMAVALAVAGGAALAVVPVGTTAGIDQASLIGSAESQNEALDRALEDLVNMRGGPPGVIAVVQRGEKREVHAFGVADLDPERPMGIDDRMRIASTAKAFSGAAALSLVGKGKLSLDDKVGDFLPGLPRKDWRKVTLGQLLNHTSGIPDFSNDPGSRKALLASLTKAPPPEELLSFVEDEKLLFAPGTEYRYSNTDNVAVALMVEEATGDSYEDQLRKRVYRPLGLRKTTLPSGPNLREPFIHGYDDDPSEQPPEDVRELVAAGWAWASGGIVSTPSDLNAFIRGYVGSELFDRETRSQQRRVFEGGGSEPPGPGNNSAGLALFRYETGCGTVWGHTGNTAGYTQFMASSPNGRRSATVSVNSQLTPEAGEPGVFEALRRAEGLAVCAALADR